MTVSLAIAEPVPAAASLCAMSSPPESASSSSDSRGDIETRRAIRELLDVLPKDVLDEINSGSIDFKDPAFLDGLTDHISRLSRANPRYGQRILPKVIKLKKLITRSLRQSDPEAVASTTIARSGQRVGRNDPCPCGSGKKHKQCCLRKE